MCDTDIDKKTVCISCNTI